MRWTLRQSCLPALGIETTAAIQHTADSRFRLARDLDQQRIQHEKDGVTEKRLALLCRKPTRNREWASSKLNHYAAETKGPERSSESRSYSKYDNSCWCHRLIHPIHAISHDKSIAHNRAFCAGQSHHLSRSLSIPVSIACVNTYPGSEHAGQE